MAIQALEKALAEDNLSGDIPHGVAQDFNSLILRSTASKPFGMLSIRNSTRSARLCSRVSIKDDSKGSATQLQISARYDF
jgi:hypothetical protein